MSLESSQKQNGCRNSSRNVGSTILGALTSCWISRGGLGRPMSADGHLLAAWDGRRAGRGLPAMAGGNGAALAAPAGRPAIAGRRERCLLSEARYGAANGRHGIRRHGWGGAWQGPAGPCKGRPGASWFRDAEASFFRPGYCPAGTFPGKGSGQVGGGGTGSGNGVSGERGVGVSGERGVGVSGERGVGVSGERGVGVSGERGVGVSGERGVGVSGERGVGVSGERGVGVSGERGVGVSGERGVGVSGERGVGVSGERGVGVSGERGVGVSGERGVGVSGERGVGVSGERGVGVSGERGVGSIGRASGCRESVGGTVGAGEYRKKGNIVEWYVWKQANLGRVSGECGGTGGDANLSKQRKGLNSWVIKKFKKRIRVE